MNILMIETSPHKNGSSNLLAENFMRGAREAGHDVTVFDAGHSRIGPCHACDACRRAENGECCQHDDMAQLRDLLLNTDLAVFVTPTYYFAMSAQLKAVIDRFYSFNDPLTKRELKTALIVAAWDSGEETFRGIVTHYRILCDYLHFQDRGMLLAGGCGTVPMTSATEWPEAAYRMGLNI